MTLDPRRLRIGFDMTLLEMNTGGSGVYARGLLGALRERDDLELNVHTPMQSGAAGTLSWMLRGARRSAARQHDDLFHSPGFLIPFRPTVPLVITIHDLSLAKMPQGHPLEWRLYYRYVFPRLVRAARAVITPTEATRRDVVADLQIDPGKVTVTPYGVADMFFRRSPPAHDPATPPIVLFAGPPIKRKNLDAVLRVLAGATAGSALKAARLRITGASAGDFPAYEGWILRNGLASRVDWLGVVPTESLPDLYASASVFAYPSFLEGFGFPPLEAMAVGTPVVSSNASCLPEVLGDAAVLVDPGDDAALATALESVISNQGLRTRMVDAGREWVGRYTWRRCAELTSTVYRSVSAAS